MTPKARPSGAPETPPICAAIAEALENTDLYQWQVAEKVGVRQNMLSRYAWSVEPAFDMVAAIENALGLPVGELFIRAGYVKRRRPTVTSAVESDPVLDDRAKVVLMATYRALAR